MDLHVLPKLRDSLSYLYVEHCILEQDDLSIARIDKDGKTAIPIASLTLLMIGPGCSITHAAVKAVCENGCSLVWCGEGGTRFYGFGIGETRSARNLLRQAELCMEEQHHIRVVMRMYERRFPDFPSQGMTLKQVRGLEGVRVREAYKVMAKRYGLLWKGRNYKSSDMKSVDPVNRALSIANACLYGLCHAAIVSMGYSPALGFIHTGKMLSFVYDIADLYKAYTTIPAAFEAAAQGDEDLDRRVRVACRRLFRDHRILKRIPEDIAWIFEQKVEEQNPMEDVGDLWTDEGDIRGGKNFAYEGHEE